MQIEVSKTNYELLMSLIDKCCTIIKQGKSNNKDYNTARRLQLTKNSIVRQIEKQNGKK
ncbi:MAG: hypothetical protein K6A67_08645 [Bacteroidales bacterium]|nr:hypothetical protein [Bacteroidales bacterium]